MVEESCQLPEMQAIPNKSLSDVLENYDNELPEQDASSDSDDDHKLTIKCIFNI